MGMIPITIYPKTQKVCGLAAAGITKNLLSSYSRGQEASCKWGFFTGYYMPLKLCSKIISCKWG